MRGLGLSDDALALHQLTHAGVRSSFGTILIDVIHVDGMLWIALLLLN